MAAGSLQDVEVKSLEDLIADVNIFAEMI